jgi:hypothetical protein
MRGCSFADDFLTLKRSEQNDGVDSGSGNTADYGLTLTGSGWFVYDIVSQPSGFSVKIQFKTSATSSGASLIGNANIVVGPLSDGFEIWVDADGVRANHYDGVGLPSNCYVDLAYADGAIHTVTYVVDMVGGTHSLYVDALAVNTQTTTISTEIGTSAAISVGRLFAGTLYKARVFDALLTEAEHDVYHAGTLETFLVKPWAVYRCNSFNDDTDGHYVWDRTTALRDLEKADRVTSSKFPVLASVPTDHYVFDGVDDYLTNPLTLPTNYTITAVKSAAGYAGGTAYPVIQQDNDLTFLTTLLAEGGYSGLLNSLIIHSKVLTPLELLQDQYQHMYDLWRGRAYGAVQRLIVEDVCKFALFLDYPAYPFTDFAGDVVGTVSGTLGGGGADGVWFQEPTGSQLLVDNDMETAGVANWPLWNGSVTTKDVTNPHGGTQCLRATHAGGAGGARQNALVAANTYRSIGWARGDGTATPRIDFQDLTARWSGTTSTSWQYFDFVSIAANTGFTPRKLAADGTWVEFDDFSLFQILNDGYLTYPDSADLECDECTIQVYGDFAASVQPGTIVDKGTNYKLRTEGNLIDFNGSTIAHTFANNESIAVTVKPGEKPRFHVDGVYIGEGSTTVTPDSTDSTELTIGSNNEHDEATQYRIKQVHIFNKALTDV